MPLRLALTAMFGLLVAAAPAHAQIRRQPGATSTTLVDVALQVGSAKYTFSGEGECKAAARASIYGIAASLASVSQRSGSESLRLTLWQPSNGAPAMLSLSIALGGKRYEVDTVHGGAKREARGSGSAKLEKAGAGGVFAISAVAASGEKISGNVRCGGFGAIHAEGG